jgi:hypothetical protein
LVNTRRKVPLARSSSRGSDSVWRGLLLAAVAGVFVWFWGSLWVWPFKMLVVTFHELSHAAAAILSGGEVLSMGISPNEAGFTKTRGGIPWVILNAGYLGSLAWGAGLLYASKSPERARTTATLLAALLAFVTIWFMRPIFSFGTLFSGFVVLGLLVTGRLASGEAAAFSLRAIGVFSVLYAFFDIQSDVLHRGPTGTTDATMLADLTGVPAMAWGVGWLALGVVVLWVMRRSLV